MPLSIPNPGTATSTITVPPLSGTLGAVRIIDLRGTVGRFDNMRFSLTSPSGVTRNIISSGWCGGNDNWDLDVRQDATNIVANNSTFCNNNPVGRNQAFRPIESFEVFNGVEPAGPWTLTVRDAATFNLATLQNWSIEVCPQ